MKRPGRTDVKSLIGLQKTHCVGDSFVLGSGVDGHLQQVCVRAAIGAGVISDELLHCFGLLLHEKDSTCHKRMLHKPIVFIVFLVLLSFVLYCFTPAVYCTPSKSLVLMQTSAMQLECGNMCMLQSSRN